MISYTGYLEALDAGELENVPAPKIAIDYWKLPEDAMLRDVVLVVREDEAAHRDTNHAFADQLTRQETDRGDIELSEVENRATARENVDA